MRVELKTVAHLDLKQTVIDDFFINKPHNEGLVLQKPHKNLAEDLQDAIHPQGHC